MWILTSFVLLIGLLFTSVSFNQWLFLVGIWIAVSFYLHYENNIWKKLGVPYLTSLPLVGNDLDLAVGFRTFQDSQRVKYKQLGDVRFGGLYSMTSPVFFVKDPELIESILIRDFSHFTDRGLPFDEKRDPLSAHLFNLPGKRWKGLRSKLSPLFTSGKLKTMHNQLIDCADILQEVLDNSCKTDESVDFKETMAKFTTDVIGSCAYGLNMNSLRDPDSEFRKMGRRLFKTSIKRKIMTTLRSFMRSIHPKLALFFQLKSFPPDVTIFFLDLVKNTVSARESNPEYNRNDFIQLIMNLRGEEKLDIKNGLTDKEKHEDVKDEVRLDKNTMAANSFLFFAAGFETTASTLSYCLFQLARNPEIQERLHQEIKNVLSKHDNTPTYEAIKNLPYMDMVISETLRMFPPVTVLFRVCTEDYQVPGTSNLIIPKGTRLDVPVYSLHHDPNYFPDPEKFHPERFSPENKDSIPKGVYLPFGDGPRICLGARFAQMEIKVCLSRILLDYKILKDSDTPDQIEFDPKANILLIPKGGIILKTAKR